MTRDRLPLRQRLSRRLRQRPRPRTAALVALSVLAALTVGLLAGLVPGRHDTVRIGFDEANLAAAAAEPPGDRVQAAIDDLLETGFHVGPELRGQLSAREVAAIQRTIAKSEVPLFVVWWGATTDAGYGTEYGALDQLRVGVGQDGYYAVVTEGRYPIVAAVGLDDPHLDADGKGRPGPALTELVTELAAFPPEPPDDYSDSDYDAWGGAGGGIAAGLLFAGLGYPVLVGVVALLSLVLPRRTGSSSPAGGRR